MSAAELDEARLEELRQVSFVDSCSCLFWGHLNLMWVIYAVMLFRHTAAFTPPRVYILLTFSISLLVLWLAVADGAS